MFKRDENYLVLLVIILMGLSALVGCAKAESDAVANVTVQQAPTVYPDSGLNDQEGHLDECLTDIAIYPLKSAVLLICASHNGFKTHLTPAGKKCKKNKKHGKDNCR